MQLALGSTIRQLRHRDGLTQETLAEALGVTAQAVSRWESGGSYPDMEMIPSIANYFGITIDDLFGYCHDRPQKIDTLVKKITDMNRQNNGVDINITECIQLAREALIEFPGNEKLMLCLASVLYNAGYVRYGEHHLKNEAGYDIYDTDLHKTYTEWKEAIILYEKVLTNCSEPAAHHQATRELIQLYANTGETEKALALASTCAGLHDSRELMLAAACDGKSRAEYLGQAILELLSSAAEQMIQSLISTPNGSDPQLAMETIHHAIALFDHICTDGEYGLYRSLISRLYLYLSEFQWRAGEHDLAFASLEHALHHAQIHDGFSGNTKICFSAPLLQHVKINPLGYDRMDMSHQLVTYWPWWCVPNCDDVKEEMQKDPRWTAWVKKVLVETE